VSQDRIVKLHRQAADEFDRRVLAVRDEQWHQPTPCTAWDVWSLVNHVVAENLWVPYTMDGATIDEVGGEFDGDVLGNDPKGRWSSSMTHALAAFEAPSATGRTVHLSRGESPAALYLEERTLDLAVHTWDLARAIRTDEELPASLVGELWHTWRPRRRQLHESGFFGTPVTIKAGIAEQSRLLALVGRVA
jgi:uncharacterized protein (TIGR03086 family)